MEFIERYFRGNLEEDRKKRVVRNEVLRSSTDGRRHFAYNNFPEEKVSEVCLIAGDLTKDKTQTIFSVRTLMDRKDSIPSEVITLHAIKEIKGSTLHLVKVHYDQSGKRKIIQTETVIETPDDLEDTMSVLFYLNQLPERIDFNATKLKFQQQGIEGNFDRPEVVLVFQR